MSYLKEVYKIVVQESEGLDAIYEDFITHLVGIKGLVALETNHLVESCGIVNGRQLYTLCEFPRK